MSDVIDAVHDEEAKRVKSQNEKRAKTIKIIVEVSIALIVVAGLIVLGYFAWR